ncbi:MAG: hypothetical protein ABSE73_14230 [Planctomycetota bacterium]
MIVETGHETFDSLGRKLFDARGVNAYEQGANPGLSVPAVGGASSAT